MDAAVEKQKLAQPLFDAVTNNRDFDPDNPLKHFDSHDARPKPELWYTEYKKEYTSLIGSFMTYNEQAALLAAAQCKLASYVDCVHGIDDFEVILHEVLRDHTPGQAMAPLELKTVTGQMLALAVDKMIVGRASRKYDPEIVRRLQAVFCQSQAAFKATRDLFSFLPCARTMMAHSRTSLVTAGIDQASIKRGVELAELMGYFSRPCGVVGYIVTDDVEAARGVNDRHDGVAEGFRTDTDFTEFFTAAERDQMDSDGAPVDFDFMLASSVAQFYFVSDDGKLQFALGHFYTGKNDTVRVFRQYKWLMEVITALYANGFKVWAVVSDQHAMNVSLRKVFTQSSSQWSETKHSVAERKREMPCIQPHGPPYVPIIHASHAGSVPLPGLPQLEAVFAKERAPVVKDGSKRRVEWTPEMEEYSCPHPVEPYPMRLFFLPDNEHMLKAFRNALASTQLYTSKKSDSEDGKPAVPRELWRCATGLDGVTRLHRCHWDHVVNTEQYDAVLHKNHKVSYMFTKQAVYLDSWTKMSMLLFDQVMSMLGAEAVATVCNEIANEHARRGRGEGTCADYLPTQPDCAGTVQMIRDIATVGVFSRPVHHNGGFGYSTPNDRRLDMMQDILDAWVSDHDRLYQQEFADDMSTSEKQALNARHEHVGFAKVTLDTFRCFLGGFRGLLYQHQMVCKQFKVTPYTIIVPTQKYLEGLFGCIRQQTTKSQMTVSEYSRRLATLSELALAKALTKARGLSVGSSLHEHSSQLSPEWIGPGLSSPYAKSPPQQTETRSEKDVTLVPCQLFNSECTALFKRLRKIIYPGSPAYSKVMGVITDLSSSRQVLDYIRCSVSEIEAAFHYFMHPGPSAKGRRKEVVTRDGAAWRKRLKQFFSYLTDAFVYNRPERWRTHVSGTVISGPGRHTFCPLSFGENVIVSYLYCCFMDDVVLPLIQKKKWNDSEIVRKGVCVPKLSELPRVINTIPSPHETCVVSSALSKSRRVESEARAAARRDLPVPDIVLRDGEVRNLTYVSGWAAAKAFASGDVDVGQFIGHLNTNMVFCVVRKAYTRRPGEGLFRPGAQFAAFARSLDAWLNVNVFLPSRVIELGGQLLLEANKAADDTDLQALWITNVVEEAKAAGCSVDATTPSVALKAMKLIVGKIARVRVFAQQKLKGLRSVDRAKQSTRGSLKSTTERSEIAREKRSVRQRTCTQVNSARYVDASSDDSDGHASVRSSDDSDWCDDE